MAYLISDAQAGDAHASSADEVESCDGRTGAFPDVR